MEQIVPFSKDLIFKTKIAEITAIGIEQSSKVEEDEILSGEFLLEGEYKITDASVQTENFEFKIPFDIALDYKYLTENTKTEINDFRYEIINSDVLRINIDLKIEGIEEEIEVELINDITEEKLPEITKPEVETVRALNIEEESKEPIREEINAEKEIQSVVNFDSSNEGYTTYKIHIVREGDTKEEICKNNFITEKILEKYNDFNEIMPLDKLIIPVINNE